MALVDFKLDDVGSLFTSIREAFTGKKIEDVNKLNEINYKLNELEAGLKNGQIAINIEEAKSSSIFVAGWRPFIGWVGGVALAYNFVLYPMILWINNIWWQVAPPPLVDDKVLLELVFAMLGVGIMRSYDKKKGTDTKKVG